MNLHSFMMNLKWYLFICIICKGVGFSFFNPSIIITAYPFKVLIQNWYTVIQL